MATITVDGLPVENGAMVRTREKVVLVRAEAEGYQPFEEQFVNKAFGKNQYVITLHKKTFSVHIETVVGSSAVYEQNRLLGQTPCDVVLEYGMHVLTLSRTDYADETCRIDVRENGSYTFQHHKEGTPFQAMGIFSCGVQPKQVIFSPDDDYILIPLLGERGFDVFSLSKLRMIKRIEPPDPSKQTGYPEGLFLKERNVFWVSQMTTSSIYEYSWPALEYKRTIPTGGVWSKYITWHSEKKIAAISNWLSNTVSIINPESGDIIKKLPTAAVPRGLAFTKDGKYLVVTAFEGGRISLFDTDTWKEIKYIQKAGSNMRHAVLSPNDRFLYVSDMGNNMVYEIAMDTFTITEWYEVDHNPNTIDISPDGKLLIVSCRGPNNPVSYLIRSPRSGYIVVIDVEQKRVVAMFSGGNQPTGLDISNNGKYLCFSNFLDNTIELFYLGDYNANYSK
ncbi:MAG TPA: beta-propeller fold lactonase family protein [Spirochaetia bacterium]|nr:beta-propeller fold lactonase family protein [Spirochaetales bacterium]HPD81210.1 beta-propeller fold lactonase family protein [Spirochaetales bacterium]HQK34565.1 beta-propeller fold lactonase family protein [Spirochaetales bacterium]HRS65546.1 beta-propeller fold lactonase family protein [Spirochaetia bacterium]HRV29410.1 beta-propeller fold lactonase family protein [Spirochaetia bacterium]